MNKSLFRKQALLHQKRHLWGNLPHGRLISLGLCSFFIILVTAVAGVYISINDYQRKETVSGHLIFREGVTLVSSGSGGRISKLSVKADDWINAGDQLFILMLDERFDGNEFYNEALMLNLSERETTILHQIELENEAFQNTQRQNAHHQQRLLSRLRALEALIETASIQADIKLTAYERVRSISSQNISLLEVENAYEAYLQQQSNLQDLSLRKTVIQEEIQELEERRELNISETNQNKTRLEQELAALREQQIRTAYLADNVIVSPVAGQVSATIHQQGDSVAAGETVLVISPEIDTLEAELFIPSSAIGFLRTGQDVNLSYEAYPYQKFGMQRGYVRSISRQVMLPEELPSDISTNEPVFEVRVCLSKQTVKAFGEELNLRSGMLLEASIIIESRSLLQWLLEPLYSVVGRVSV